MALTIVFPACTLLGQMDDLDLSAYDELCNRFLLEGLVRHVLFEDDFGTLGWNVDLNAGTVSFVGRGDRGVELLGTFNRADDTFLWSWANPTAEEWNSSVTRHARALRQRGNDEEGLAAFQLPKIADGWVGFRELGLVAGALAGRPLVIRDAGGPLVLLLVDEDVPPVPPDPAVWPRILMSLGEVYGGPQQPCVVGFLQAHGQLEEATATRIIGRFGPGAELAVNFDGHSRIRNVSASLSG